VINTRVLLWSAIVQCVNMFMNHFSQSNEILNIIIARKIHEFQFPSKQVLYSARNVRLVAVRVQVVVQLNCLEENREIFLNKKIPRKFW
jgi:hypothetical protein